MYNRFTKIKDTTRYQKGMIHISGLSEGRTAPVLSLIAGESGRALMVITSSQARARGLYEDLSYFSKLPVLLLPEDDRFFLSYDAKSHGDLEGRLGAMIRLSRGEPCIVIAAAQSALKKLMPSELFRRQRLVLEAGEVYALSGLKALLGKMGYEKTERVEAKGQYSLRGDILDVFPYDRQDPVRVEFFDDTVDSIRSFQADTQRSGEGLERVALFPAHLLWYDDQTRENARQKLTKAYDRQALRLEGEAKAQLLERKEQLLELIETGRNNQSLSEYVSYFYSEPETLVDYMDQRGILILEDFVRTKERLSFSDKESKEDFQILLEKGRVTAEDFPSFTKSDILMHIAEGRERLVYLLTPFGGALKGSLQPREIVSVRTRPIPGFSGKMDFFLEEMRRYQREGFEVVIICSSGEREENIRNFLGRNDIFFPRIVTGQLSGGSEYTDEKLALISDNDIFPSHKVKKTKAQRKDAKPIRTFVDIQRGDYVVHESHGIGRFVEIQQLEIEGHKRDYLKIQYAGEDVLYVPVDQMDSVQKYIGSEGTAPRINKLSSGEWKKTKEKVKTAIQQMARELLELSAARLSMPGYGFSPDTLWQAEFEDQFPYVETEDQLRCVREIKEDMERPVPMDRLLCGDVGYGKTEVAARAVFKCIADGKQAAVLVPTTILANQHYHTFSQRLEPFPFKVEMLSRFRTEKQQKEIVRKVEKGEIDVLIGTHRMLSPDVRFRDLGLLIIDEEQRFGVQHKEAIKLLRKNVDVLTLSATPIPRTLHMSLIGARDMSLIEEPPEERYPVQTYVMQQEDDIIRGAILNELERGGQVFVVFNRVREIRKVAAHIGELVPEARISVGHGQMSETSLENVIIDFIEQKSDVLVCTTIIETGIDMPNANTMLILDADRFGLSQLYQLRGRVGRSNRLAYAYLFYRKDKVLSEVAEKRLTAIREFTEFGSGFKLAMRDLELRGAGNLLGTEQHGHMAMIGYELYCKLLEDTMKVLKGVKQEEELPETVIEMEVNAYLPQSYIENETVKVEIYQKIAAIRNEEDRDEVLDELIDRFGDVPRAVDNLITISWIKAMLAELGVEKLSEKAGKAIFTFYRQNSLKPEMIARLMSAYGTAAFVNGGRKPFIRYEIRDKKHKLEDLLQFVRVMRGQEKNHK